jgi:hypothetical protein
MQYNHNTYLRSLIKDFNNCTNSLSLMFTLLDYAVVEVNMPPLSASNTNLEKRK